MLKSSNNLSSQTKERVAETHKSFRRLSKVGEEIDIQAAIEMVTEETALTGGLFKNASFEKFMGTFGLADPKIRASSAGEKQTRTRHQVSDDSAMLDLQLLHFIEINRKAMRDLLVEFDELHRLKQICDEQRAKVLEEEKDNESNEEEDEDGIEKAEELVKEKLSQILTATGIISDSDIASHTNHKKHTVTFNMDFTDTTSSNTSNMTSLIARVRASTAAPAPMPKSMSRGRSRGMDGTTPRGRTSRQSSDRSRPPRG